MSAASIALPAIAMGGALAWVSLHFWRGGQDLSKEGVEARATLVRKFRNPDDTFLFGLENYFVTATFLDLQNRQRTIDVRVPSRQWHLLREGSTASILCRTWRTFR